MPDEILSNQGGFDAEQQKEPVSPPRGEGGEGWQGQLNEFLKSNFCRKKIKSKRMGVEMNDVKVVDSRCHSLTAPHVREKHQTDSQVNMFIFCSPDIRYVDSSYGFCWLQ